MTSGVNEAEINETRVIRCSAELRIIDSAEFAGLRRTGARNVKAKGPLGSENHLFDSRKVDSPYV